MKLLQLVSSNQFPGRILTISVVTLCMMGCQAPKSTEISEVDGAKSGSLTLREGDSLKIEFPGTPALNSPQVVRRDGKISLQSAGELSVVALTPSELEKKLLEIYGPQLVTKEVTVTVQSSNLQVFVNGAVLQPGALVTDRPVTVLEAIMAKGGPTPNKADIRRVVVIRNENGQTKRFILNLKTLLDGTTTNQFYLRPSDIVIVPEKFGWI